MDKRCIDCKYCVVDPVGLTGAVLKCRLSAVVVNGISHLQTCEETRAQYDTVESCGPEANWFVGRGSSPVEVW